MSHEPNVADHCATEPTPLHPSPDSLIGGSSLIATIAILGTHPSAWQPDRCSGLERRIIRLSGRFKEVFRASSEEIKPGLRFTVNVTQRGPSAGRSLEEPLGPWSVQPPAPGQRRLVLCRDESGPASVQTALSNGCLLSTPTAKPQPLFALDDVRLATLLRAEPGFPGSLESPASSAMLLAAQKKSGPLLADDLVAQTALLSAKARCNILYPLLESEASAAIYRQSLLQGLVASVSPSEPETPEAKARARLIGISFEILAESSPAAFQLQSHLTQSLLVAEVFEGDGVPALPAATVFPRESDRRTALALVERYAPALGPVSTEHLVAWLTSPAAGGTRS